MAVTSEYCFEDLDNQTILELFRKHPDPALTASEIAEAFEITNQAANKRINQLVDQDRVKKKKVGGAAVVYWRSNGNSI
jgi:predicted transcriptional regulator